MKKFNKDQLVFILVYGAFVIIAALLMLMYFLLKTVFGLESVFLGFIPSVAIAIISGLFVSNVFYYFLEKLYTGILDKWVKIIYYLCIPVVIFFMFIPLFSALIILPCVIISCILVIITTIQLFKKELSGDLFLISMANMLLFFLGFVFFILSFF